MREQASAIVVESVPRELTVGPTDLPEQLYSVLDPDALDSLFAGRENTADPVMFSHCGYDGTVTGGGDVILES
ncbi:hypothetical protein HUG10_06220 [Halorarum halophilum]|uniref:Halobacterial output domain-containing protein n=1 Tax=Halorarum halophilum TaxID=2743090 RepID=A0A7D5KNL8_9EURY|nr:hypothetical protein HUG10_06220 [Halobaculum halophilum]